MQVEKNGKKEKKEENIDFQVMFLEKWSTDEAYGLLFETHQMLQFVSDHTGTDQNQLLY